MSETVDPRAMKGLAVVRIALGAVAWCAPQATNRVFGVPRDQESAALTYMHRVSGFARSRSGSAIWRPGVRRGSSGAGCGCSATPRTP